MQVVETLPLAFRDWFLRLNSGVAVMKKHKMSLNLVLFAVVIVALTGCGSGGGSATTPATVALTTGTYQSRLGSYTLTVPSSVRQNDVVPITYFVTNITNSAINFYLLMIGVQLNNTEIYRSSGDSNFVTIAPGESKTFTTSWNSKDNNGNYVAAGNYRLVGSFRSTSGIFGEATDVPVPFVVQ